VTSREFAAGRIELTQGDITRQNVDAIVNAANSSLMGGGGVDGAIHRAGGPDILAECQKIRAARGPLPSGEAVITAAGRLPCRYVIHAVGPIWRGGTHGEPEILRRCYRNSLALAAAHGLESVALPSISTGAYGYPVERAASIALQAGRDALIEGSPPRLLRWVLFGAGDLSVYESALASL
jgi:O-acetyl-ADP-ribose deacetylase (regulator of RNase III)